MPVAPPVRLRPARSAAFAALALFAAFLLAPPGVGLAAERTVHIADGTLSPSTLTIAPNTIVRWVNDEGNRHRMRSTAGPAEFDSGDLDPGSAFSFTFAVEGTYAYRDERNKDDDAYRGTIVVSAAATPAPTPPPPTPRPTPAPPGGTPPPGATAPPATPAPPAAAPAVRMAGRVFRPATVAIDAGQSVVFINDDGRDHTATARDRSFDTGNLAPGQRATRTFSTPGTFAYFCVIHPDMTGTIAVRGAAGATPPPPPPPTPAPKPTPVPTAPAGGVSVVDFAFRPSSLTVTAGATVTWINRGAAPHTVTANDKSFDSGVFVAGARYTRTFSVPGTYQYTCTLHPQMVGTLFVAPKSGGPIPTPRPTPKPPRPPPPATAATVDAADLFFRPETISVRAGTTVTWRNVGAAPHTVTARDGSFDSGIFDAGATWSHTFAAPGTFAYVCAVHPQMTGTIVITLTARAAAGAGPASSPGPDPGMSPSTSPSPSPGVAALPGAAASATPEAPPAGTGTGGEAAGGAGDGTTAAADPLSAPIPSTSPQDPLRLLLVGALSLGAMGAFAAVVRGLVPAR